MVKLYTGSMAALGNSGWASKYSSETRAEEKTVPMISLDEYARSARIQSVRLVKIGVEGVELDVVYGMKTLLSWPDSPDLFCEVRPYYSRELIDFLAGHGYTFYPSPFSKMLGPGDILHVMMDLFCTKRPDQIANARGRWRESGVG